MPTNFHVIKVEKGRPSQLILGGGFLATAGAIMDWLNQTVFFANIDDEVFHKTVPFTQAQKGEGGQMARARKNLPRSFNQRKVA